MRIQVLESTEQARNFQLDNKELEKINVWPDKRRWLADFKSRKNKLIYYIFLLKIYIFYWQHFNNSSYHILHFIDHFKAKSRRLHVTT